MSEQRDERWAFGTSLDVENPSEGVFRRNTIFSSIQLGVERSNWVVTSVPSPNVLEGWTINSVMLRYQIGGEGRIDKIGIRDGDTVIGEFAGLQITENNANRIPNWDTLKLQLPGPRTFRQGLGVMIHVNGRASGGGGPGGMAELHFTSIGLEFIKSTSPPVVNPKP